MHLDYSYGIIALKKLDNLDLLLLVQHTNARGAHWGFPKGHAENNESPLEAAKREFSEETGLKVEELLDFEPLVQEYSFKSRKGLEIQKTVQYYLAKVSDTKPRLPKDEIQALRWLSFEEASSLLEHASNQKLLKSLTCLLFDK